MMYSVNLETARELVSDLFVDCCRGRPDICPPELQSTVRRHDLSQSRIQTEDEMAKYNVLFLCTGNSVRSLFAESILNSAAGDRFNAYSAGTSPRSEINPKTLEVLVDRGHDISTLRCKNVDEFRTEHAPDLDFVFTVCDDAANEDCLPWSGQPLSAHWGQPDPAKAEAPHSDELQPFQDGYALLRNRIHAFAALPLESMDKVALQKQMDEIGQMELVS